MVDDRFADHSAEPRHPIGEPPWNLSAVQRQISASSSLSHRSDPPRSLDHVMLGLQVSPLKSSLPQPSLEQSFFTGLGKLRDVGLHASLDATLSWWHVATKLSDVGSARSCGCHCPGSHLRHSPGCRDQQNGTGGQNAIQHCVKPRLISRHHIRVQQQREADASSGRVFPEINVSGCRAGRTCCPRPYPPESDRRRGALC